MARMIWKDAHDMLYDASSIDKAAACHDAEMKRRAADKVPRARARQVKDESKDDTAYSAAIRLLIYTEQPGSLGRIRAGGCKTNIGPSSDSELVKLETLLTNHGYEVTRWDCYLHLPDPVMTYAKRQFAMSASALSSITITAMTQRLLASRGTAEKRYGIGTLTRTSSRNLL